MKNVDVWIWIIILMCLIETLIMTNPFKIFTKKYWENRLWCHRCKRDNRAHICATTKEDIESWEREEQRLIRKIQRYENKQNKKKK